MIGVRQSDKKTQYSKRQTVAVMGGCGRRGMVPFAKHQRSWRIELDRGIQCESYKACRKQ